LQIFFQDLHIEKIKHWTINFKMPECKEYFSVAPLKAIIVRLVFAVHSLVSIYRVVEAYQNPYYWLLLISLVGLLIETVITLVKRAGKEWTW